MTILVIVAAAVTFFALVMASVALHELGHLLPGKLFGIKVSRYFVGFGRTLWSTKRGETEYGLKLLPMGGYVRLEGMFPPAGKAGDKPSKPNPFTRLADAAREAEYETITPADDGRLFYQKKTWQKVIVMAGGITMNLLLAFVILLGVNVLHGQYEPTLTIAMVNDCVIPQSRTAEACTTGDPVSPAKAAGVHVGDVVVSFNGTPVSNWDSVSKLIRANGAGTASIVVRRDGQLLTLPTVHTIVTGVPDTLDPSKTVEAGFLGVSPDEHLVRLGPLATATDMWSMTKQSVVALGTLPVKVWNVLTGMIQGKQRDANSPISIVGASIVAGEIAGSSSLGLGDKLATWFTLLGSLNLFVGLLNLVPLLPFDGGHIAGALYEGARRLVARVAHRRDPGPVDTAKMLPVAYVVGAFLAVAGVVLVLADVISPVTLF